jgi:hypothetical protein
MLSRNPFSCFIIPSKHASSLTYLLTFQVNRLVSIESWKGGNMAKKAEPLHKVTLELTDKELRELASRRIKRWTDFLLPVGALVGLLALLSTITVIGVKPSIIESILIGLSGFSPIVLGFIISYYCRIKLVKAKVQEWKGNKGK